MNNMNEQSKFWCFTLNNPTEMLDLDVPYYIYQEEVGENGTYHFQGYLELKRSQRKSYVINLIPGAHFEKRRGTQEDAINYCKKRDETYIAGPYEYGTPAKGQGYRSDLEKACKIIKEKGLDVLKDECPEQYVKYHTGFEKLALHFVKPYQHDTVRGIWIWGEPGSGKTHKATTEYGEYYEKAQNKWWDGYNGEETVLLDDLDTDVLAHHIKRWADKYPCKGETKGGHVHLQHKRFIVTSNFCIQDLFQKQPIQMIHAIQRRFQEINL